MSIGILSFIQLLLRYNGASTVSACPLVRYGGDPMSCLTIDITDQQHQSLKALAALQGKTVEQYALERLFPSDTDADQAWQDLKTLVGTRISEGLAGKVSTKSINEILNEELT
ncbi:hypothetical protein P305_11680 [Xylella fastidiosa subsp. fastidiosa Mus-1]|nr:hypothetical protein P305_11680 [Xylella fastidiosa subsp. fastidiosa Mus-1]